MRMRGKRAVRVSWAAALGLALAGCGGGDSSPAPLAPPSGLSYPTIPALVVGVPMAPVVPTVSGTVTGYSVSPALPAGLALDSTTGEISGTPASPSATAGYVLRASNSAGSAVFTLDITVNAAGEFRLEPAPGTTIGVGQQIDLFAAYKAHSTDPYPLYVDSAQVTFASSQPGVALPSAGGGVRGLAAGSATITATYGSWSSQITIRVAGRFVDRSIAVPGQGTRGYSIYIPDGVSGPRPLLLALHGGGGNARINASMTLLDALGADEGIFIVYPEGSGALQTFNAGLCCGSAQTQNVDDVAFVSALLDDVEANYPVDVTRVFSSGFSNGGMMSYRLACALADRISGIAAVSGASGQFDRDGNAYYACNPSRPIPILHLHATNDRNYPFDGGFGEGLSDRNFLSVDATISDWRTRNNVAAQATEESLSASTVCYHYDVPLDPGLPSAPVTLCKSDPVDVFDPATGIVYGGGHSWPGGNRSPAAGSDQPATDFSANDYLWRFLAR